MGRPSRQGSSSADALALLDYWTPLLVRLCVDQGVFDAYGTATRRDDDVAASLGADSDVLRRIVRALSARGLFEKGADGEHFLTELGRPLLSGPGSLAGLASFKPWELHAWAEARHTLRNGEPAFPLHYGTDYFSWLCANADAFTQFTSDMRRRTHSLIASGLSAYPWPATGTVVDVGGGSGHLLAAVLHERPGMRGVLMDLPQVLQGAREFLEGQGLGERVALAPGSFFDGVPPGADFYVLASVLHDWDDEDAGRILGACRAAMTPSSKVVLYEAVLDEGFDSPLSFGLDLHMAVQFGGRERARAEWHDLLKRAGLRLMEVIGTPGLCWLEAELRR